jgi:hypothetical protein
MKNILLFLIVFSVSVMAQNNTLKVFSDTFTPSTLFAGTPISSRTLSTSYNDTTREFNTRGYAAVYVGLETSTNDSARVLVSYSISKDGVNFQNYILLDSLSSTGEVGICKYVALPANALGAYAVRVRLYGDANVARYSINPSTKLTAKIIRVPYNDVKIK